MLTPHVVPYPSVLRYYLSWQLNYNIKKIRIKDKGHRYARYKYILYYYIFNI